MGGCDLILFGGSGKGRKAKPGSSLAGFGLVCFGSPPGLVEIGMEFFLSYIGDTWRTTWQQLGFCLMTYIHTPRSD